jgi:hypothetical protein
MAQFISSTREGGCRSRSSILNFRCDERSAERTFLLCVDKRRIIDLAAHSLAAILYRILMSLEEKNMKKYLFVCLPIILLVSCSWFAETIEWQDDGNGWLQFSTNDPTYKDSGNFVHIQSSYQSPTGIVEVRTQKVSGGDATVWGVIWNYQDANNFFLVLISADGWFREYLKWDGVYNEGNNWSQWPYINQGLDAVNVIRIDGSTGRIYINNMVNFAGSFSVPGDFPGGNAGEAGFYVLVGDDPIWGNPVDIRFQMASPVVVPSAIASLGRSVWSETNPQLGQ